MTPKTYKDIINGLYGRYACIYEKECDLKDDPNQTTTCVKKIYNAVSISAAITAYARIYMYKLQDQLKTTLIYWDTDGFFLKEALSDNQVSTSLGSLRLIHKIDKIVFIAQKMYIYRYNQGDYQYTLKGMTVSNYYLDGATLRPEIENALLKSVNPNKSEYTINFELKNESTNHLLYFVKGLL